MSLTKSQPVRKLSVSWPKFWLVATIVIMIARVVTGYHLFEPLFVVSLIMV